jgi:hypothetical protein
MSKKAYNQGKLPKLFDLLVNLHREQPYLFENADDIRRKVGEYWKALHDKSTCPNCKASMVSYWFEFDTSDAAMLISMSRIVRARIEKGILFTEANQVHVPSMITSSYTMKSRTSKMSKLGLVAKVLKDGKHVGGYWLITRRGWTALANAPVPKKVEVFRNEIIERAEGETITISQVFAQWKSKHSDMVKRGKKVKTDYTDEITEYQNHNDWVHLGGIQPGELI